jgi:hypothetical protein
MPTSKVWFETTAAMHGIAATEERTNADKPRAGAYDD